MLAARTIKQIRLQRLLRAGYFPSELPPPFTTRDFSDQVSALESAWPVNDVVQFWTSAEHYSIPRYGTARRKLSIVNPVNQFGTSKIISDNWVDLHTRLKSSSISEFRPSISLFGGRAVNGVDFDGVARRRARILAKYGRYIKTDIARFYPSIYTHSIAWAILGKSWVKANMKTPAFKGSFANLLDKSIQAGQAGQTIGIPIGPDTSRIISELIACDIESQIGTSINDFKDRAVRYVDDMIIGIKSNESDSLMISRLSSALYDYELEINAEKTTTHGVGSSFAPDWLHFVQHFDISKSPQRQREDIDSFFEQLLHLSSLNPRENVILYGVKASASFDIAKQNLVHLVRWYLFCCRNAPSCIQFVVEHLSYLFANGEKLPISEIEEFILDTLPTKALEAHTAEVSWLLFWALELRITLDASLFENVKSLRSSVVAMLTLDLRQRGQISGRIDDSFWRSFSNSNGLQSELWLVAYEGTRRGWWRRSLSTSFISSHKYFGHLIAHNVSFYDQSRKSRPRVGKPLFGMIKNAVKSGRYMSFATANIGIPDYE